MPLGYCSRRLSVLLVGCSHSIRAHYEYEFPRVVRKLPISSRAPRKRARTQNSMLLDNFNDS
jgi:hypothetical protein